MKNPQHLIRRILTTVALALMALPVAAQPRLEGLASPEAALAVSLRSSGELPAQLSEDFAAIDWSGASDTLTALLGATGEIDDDLITEFSDIGATLEGLPSLAGSLLVEVCAAAQPAVDSLLASSARPDSFEALFTVETTDMGTPFTLLLRLGGLPEQDLSTLATALSECADETVDTIPGGAPVLRFGEIGDALFLNVGSDGLIVAGDDQESVAAVVARAQGQAEPAAGSPLARLEDPAADGVSFAIAVQSEAVLSELGGMLTGMTMMMGGTAPLAEMIASAIDTVDGLAVAITLDDRGLLGEGVVQIDPTRPDAELARLLLCEGCTRLRPYLAPQDAVAFSTSGLPLAALFNYLTGYLAAAELDIDPREWLQTELGVDIDRDLLDWLGDDGYSVMLGVVDTDLWNLVYQPGQALVIPVTSAEEARAALERLSNELPARVEESLGDESLPLALRTASYRDHEYLHLQASLNLDLAVGLVGDNLVVAYPSAAIREIIDTFHGAPSVLETGAYRRAVEGAPEAAHSVSYQDSSSMLAGIASLLRFASQPLAFGIHTILAEESSASGGELWPMWGGIDLTDVPSTPIVPGEALVADLDPESDPVVDGNVSDLYELGGLTPGDQVTVVMESEAIDTYLYLLTPEGDVLLSNDDSPDTSRSELTFVAPEGKLLVQATSFFGEEAGVYDLSVQTTPAEQAPELPGYGELLTLTEIPAAILDVLTNNFGASYGYAVSEDGTLYWRSLTELR